MKKIIIIFYCLASLVSNSQTTLVYDITKYRGILGLGTCCTLNTSEILQVSNNLSELNAATARTNLGLGNVTNTSDANKPVSTAQQSALDLKANLASPAFTGTVSGITASMVGLGNCNNTSDAAKPVSTATQTALDLKANLISPSFTTPNLGTPSAGTLTNCTFPTLNQNTTGSAAKLTTARTIDGNSFDGTANVGFTKVSVTSSDVTNSTTTMADITGLVTGTLTNAAVYEFDILLDVSSSTTAGATFQVVLGGSGSGSLVALKVLATGVTTASDITASATPTGSVVTINGEGVVLIKGIIKTLSAGTATVKLQQAKTTSGNIITRVNSYMKYKLL